MNKKKMVLLFGIISIVVVILIVCVTFFVIPSVKKDILVSEKEIIEEVVNSMFDERDEVVQQTKIESRITQENEDTVIVSVISSNDEVEYIEKYMIKYIKGEDGWTLEQIGNYESNEWEKKPRKAPTTSELIENSKKYMHNHSSYEFDEFNEATTSAIIDLEKGSARYFYEIKKYTPMQHIHGELAFEYHFNNDTEEWECISLSQANSYKEEIDMFHSWYWNENAIILNHEYRFKVTNQDEKSIVADLYVNNKYHQMSGKFDVRVKNIYVELFDVEDKSYYLCGTFDIETGEFGGTLYTAYDENKLFYYGYEMLDVELYIE